MKSIVKENNLRELAAYREHLCRQPKLSHLFFELTDACNMSCIHCGSCASPRNRTYLSFDSINKVLEEVAKKYSAESIMICLTGGEPMLHPDFYKIAQRSRELGFFCGITTNATLIDSVAAEKIKESGICAVSVSLDGTREMHDWFRSSEGAFEKALKGIRNLLRVGGSDIAVQITTVVHKKNIGQLDEIYDIVLSEKADSWRIVNLDPIGRAMEHEELHLGKDEFRYLIDYIRNKRFDNKNPIHTTYGCAHYLGLEYENEIRDHYFFCDSGISVASVICNGDIYSCLDIERRPELVQGNVFNDSFTDVWENRFKEFRRDRTEDCSDCRNCEDRQFCRGDAAHTWDYDKKMPKVCYKNLLSI